MSVLKVDINNINKGTDDLRRYSDLLDKAIHDGILELCDRMKSKMEEYIVLYGIDNTGELRNSIKMIPYPTGVLITVGADYASFVEYGTGIVGSQNPHPSPKITWTYDVNSHGESGWWYPTTSSDPNPNKYLTADGKWLAWTKGQKSRPFMYMTWLWAKRSYTQILRKHIRRIKL